MPRVSVLLPVYNGESYLARAIDSVLQQTFENFELLVLDDGSTDGSQAIARAAAARDARIRVIAGEHRGLVDGLNSAANMAAGELLARMDADDISLPDRFAKQVSYLDAHPEVCAVGCPAMRIDPDGLPISSWPVPESHEEIDAQHMTGLGGGILQPSVMMRKSSFLQVGGYRAEFKYGAEDYDLFLRMAEIGKLANLPEILLQYRLHLKSVTVRRHEEQLPAARRALEDAKLRRKLTEPLPYRQYHVGSGSEDEMMWIWSRAAFAGRNFRTARKYAIRLLLRHPWKLRIWVLFSAACLGPLALKVKRLSPYRLGPSI